MQSRVDMSPRENTGIFVIIMARNPYFYFFWCIGFTMVSAAKTLVEFPKNWLKKSSYRSQESLKNRHNSAFSWVKEIRETHTLGFKPFGYRSTITTFEKQDTWYKMKYRNIAHRRVVDQWPCRLLTFGLVSWYCLRTNFRVNRALLLRNKTETQKQNNLQYGLLVV